MGGSRGFGQRRGNIERVQINALAIGTVPCGVDQSLSSFEWIGPEKITVAPRTLWLRAVESSLCGRSDLPSTAFDRKFLKRSARYDERSIRH